MLKQIIFIHLMCWSTLSIANFEVKPLSLTQIGKIQQIDVADNDELVVINQKGELWQIGQTMQRLAEHVSPHVTPEARYGRIALADAKDHFMLWTADNIYYSTIPVAKKAKMQALDFATISVIQQGNHYKLARIEARDNSLNVTAVSQQNVLPDARPIQINLTGINQADGHIAVLAEPDETTYQHGVLGDSMEAKSLIYLERHTLKPLAKALHQVGLVFEANQLTAFQHTGKTHIVSVMSGQSEGARTVIIELDNQELKIISTSDPLPINRWQSPFVFNHTLYAVQMPHLVGRLVQYRATTPKLQTTLLESGLSNHAYGEYETDLTASTAEFVVIPHFGYKKISIIDKHGKFTPLKQTLPAEIHYTVSNTNAVYLLLKNGQIWSVASKQKNQ